MFPHSPLLELVRVSMMGSSVIRWYAIPRMKLLVLAWVCRVRPRIRTIEYCCLRKRISTPDCVSVSNSILDGTTLIIMGSTSARHLPRRAILARATESFIVDDPGRQLDFVSITKLYTCQRRCQILGRQEGRKASGLDEKWKEPSSHRR